MHTPTPATVSSGCALVESGWSNEWLRSQSAEVQLLMSCFSRGNRKQDAESLKLLLRQSLNWTLLTRMTRYHALAELVYANIGRVNHLALDPQFQAAICQAAAQSAANAHTQMGEIARISQLVSSQSIPIIHVKGAVLSHHVYGDSALRASGDMDMLVRREHAAKTLAILRSDGYEPTIIESKKLATWEMIERPEILELGSELSLRKDRHVIDLHWELMKPSTLRIPEDEFWKNPAQVSFADQALLTLEPSLNFIFLARHAAKHGWERLRWIADLIYVLESEGFDYDLLMSTARRFGYEKFVLFAIAIATQCSGNLPPDELVAEINRHPDIIAESRRILSMITSFKKSGAMQTFFSLSKMEGTHVRRFLLVLQEMLEPTLRDWEQFPLRTSWRPVYTLLRPWRLLRQYRRFLKPTLLSKLHRTL